MPTLLHDSGLAAPSDIRILWHGKNQQHEDFNDYHGGQRAGNVACIFHAGTVLCELLYKGPAFFRQSFGDEYISDVLRTGTDLRQLWDRLVWDRETRGILSSQDKHVDMDHLLARLQDELQGCIEFQPMAKVFLNTYCVSKFKCFAALLVDLQESLQNCSLAVRPAFILCVDGKFSLVVQIKENLLLFFDPHSAGKPPNQDRCVTALFRTVEDLASFLLREDSMYKSCHDGAVQLGFWIMLFW